MNDMTIRTALHEWLVLRPVFDDLVRHVCKREADPKTVPLADVLAGLNNMGLDRFAALVYAHHYGDTMEDATAIATEVLVAIRSGQRPRQVTEMMTPAELAVLRERTPPE